MSNCGSIEIGGGDPPEEPDEITILFGGTTISGGEITTEVTYESNVLSTGTMTVLVAGTEIGTRVISVDDGTLTSELTVSMSEVPFGSNLPVVVELEVFAADATAVDEVDTITNEQPDPGDADIYGCSASFDANNDLIVEYTIFWPHTDPQTLDVLVEVDGLVAQQTAHTVTSGEGSYSQTVDYDALPVGEDMPVNVLIAV